MTLHIYFARKFTWTVLGLTMVFAVLLAMVDFVDHLGRYQLLYLACLLVDVEIRKSCRCRDLRTGQLSPALDCYRSVAGYPGRGRAAMGSWKKFASGNGHRIPANRRQHWIKRRARIQGIHPGPLPILAGMGASNPAFSMRPLRLQACPVSGYLIG